MNKKLAANLGAFFENRVGGFIERRDEAPLLIGKPRRFQWYRAELPDGMSGDGSEFHMYIRRGESDDLCVFFSGGGVAWNEYTAARPTDGARTAANEPNYYWNNLRPFTQIMNINVGITENDRRNPFYSWNFIVVPYSTGDFHVGDSDFEYTGTDGEKAVLHFHGKKNADAALSFGKRYFPSAKRLLIAGDSAGGFAAPAQALNILDNYYPDAADVTVFSDSALLLSDKWRDIARDVWQADHDTWSSISGDNITLEWYRRLVGKYPGRLRILYSSSTHDYLLSTFYNDMTNKEYGTDYAVREEFFSQLKGMVRDFRDIDPNVSFFINKWENPLFTFAQGGTIHTCVREPYFFVRNMADARGVTMAEWLSSAVDGTCYDAGTEALS